MLHLCRISLCQVLLVVCLSPGATAGSESLFSGGNAYAVLRVLAGDIGPRPMGSPAEQRAVAFAVERFRAYGCDTAYVLPMTVAGGVNTASGVAVGILRGTSGRIIILGSHLDSSGPDIPGANDNGSGTACVIELSRVLARRPHNSTIMFCCFGGEEEGLRGSEYFVDHFDGIDSVVMMLQIDMADGHSYLELDPDGPHQVSAPRWLPEAAMDLYYNELGYTRLHYLTHASTFNASSEGATGSDHAPFLKKGIPALDLTSDVTYPIHTPLDNLALFDSSGLARSGRLVEQLVGRFDAGVPSRATESYYLVQFGTHLFFIDHWILWIGIGAALGLGVILLVHLRRRRRVDRSGLPRWSTSKLLLATLVIQAFIWLAEIPLGELLGYRFPWVNNFSGYVLFALLSGAIGFWIVLRQARRFRLSPDPYVYYLRAFVLFVVAILGLSAINPELALYPASALFFLALALFVRQPIVRSVFFLVALYLPLRLVFLEPLGLLQRGVAQSMTDAWWKQGLYETGFILIFSILSLPFVYGFAAVYRGSGKDLFWLRRFKTAPALAGLLLALVACGVYLSGQTVYDTRWQKQVRAEQRYTVGAEKSTLKITGGEYLQGLHVSIAGNDTTLTSRTTLFAPDLPDPSRVEWVRFRSSTSVKPDTSAPDTLEHIEHMLTVESKSRPLAVQVVYRSAGPFSLTSSWALGSRRRGVSNSDRVKVMSWYAFPDSTLVVPVSLTFHPGQEITETVELTYDRLSAPVQIERELTTVSRRTVVTREDTIRAHAPGHNSVSVQ
jgi:hypothetical protein